MKYTYKLLHKYIPRLNNLSDMLLNPKEDNDEFEFGFLDFDDEE